jgi:uncharacterized membrane protein YphA (DoxX/SURF4 family)
MPAHRNALRTMNVDSPLTDAVLTTARFGLAVVFVVAGPAKLKDTTGTRQALVEFGMAVDETRALYRGHTIKNVLAQNGHAVSDMFHVSSTPSAVIVEVDGTVGSPVRLRR